MTEKDDEKKIVKIMDRFDGSSRPLLDRERLRPWGVPDVQGYYYIGEQPVNKSENDSEEPAAGRDPDLTIIRVLLLFDDLMPDFKAAGNNRKKAEFVSTLTGFDAETVRKRLSELHARKDGKAPHDDRNRAIVDVWKKKLMP